MTVLLTAPVDDAGELALRAQAVLREAGWFVRCEGEADASRVSRCCAAGTIVASSTAWAACTPASTSSGACGTRSRGQHLMRFVLVRNAVGPAADRRTDGRVELIL